MEEMDYRDRRKNTRFRVRNCVVRYADTHFQSFRTEHAGDHQLLDLSRGGMKFVAQWEVAPGTQLAISLHVPAYANPIPLTGKVAWCRSIPGEEGVFLVGLAFGNLVERSAEALRRLEQDGKLRSLQKVLQLPGC